MGRKSTAPPSGADVLYSRFEVEWREGLVRICAHSGAHIQIGVVTLSDAVRLHRLLAVAIDQARAESAAALFPPLRAAEPH